MDNTCGECKRYKNCMDEKYGVCDANMGVVYENDGVCRAFERRLTMEKGITISQDRFEYFLRVEARYELAQSIYRSFDRYTSDDVLGPILGPRELPKEDKCETI